MKCRLTSLIFIVILSVLAGVFNRCARPESLTNPTSSDTSISDTCITKAIGLIPLFSATDSLLIQTLKGIYHSENNLIWFKNQTPTKASTEVTELLKKSYLYGLLPWWYKIPDNTTTALNNHQLSANDDVTTSMATLRFLLHTAIGVQQTHDRKATQTIVDSLIVPAFMLMKNGQIIEAIDKIEPAVPFYNQLKKTLPDFTMFFDHFILKGKESSGDEKEVIWKLMQQSGFYKHLNPLDERDFRLVLASWQKANLLNPDGELSFDTRKRLSTMAMAHFYKIAINLERIRQNPPNNPVYLWVNVPEFRLYACQKDEILDTWKVIVGQPKTPTPIITSTMSHVLTYPQWNIPPSIVVKEVLPDMRKDPMYLQRKGYVITNWQGERLNPASVSIYSYTLNNHPYNIMQPPGSDNALGILKFLFDNDDTVYLHDTNSRNLFARNFRALSHGCIRVQEPHRLAEFLLDKDAVSLMDKQLSAKRNCYIKITRKVGICIRYITCKADDNGNLSLITDMYNKDPKELEAFLTTSYQ